MANGERRTLSHFYLRRHGEREEFTSPRSGGGGQVVPARNREQHAHALEMALTQAIAAAEQQIQARDSDIAGGTAGFYLEFDLPKAQQPLLDKLEDRRGREQIELLSVRPSSADPENLISATVFVPESKKGAYLKKVENYRTQETRTGKPKNEPLVASIEAGGSRRFARCLRTIPPCFRPTIRKRGGKSGCGRMRGRYLNMRPAV